MRPFYYVANKAFVEDTLNLWAIFCAFLHNVLNIDCDNTNAYAAQKYKVWFTPNIFYFSTAFASCPLFNEWSGCAGGGSKGLTIQ